VTFGSAAAPNRHCAWWRGGADRRSGHGASPTQTEPDPLGRAKDAKGRGPPSSSGSGDRIYGAGRGRKASAGKGEGNESAIARAKPRWACKGRRGFVMSRPVHRLPCIDLCPFGIANYGIVDAW